MDDIIRKGYRGGATQLFIHKGNNLRYYDVNSLYPHSITFPIPLTYLDFLYANEIKLETFTGFIQARVTVPENIPGLLPYHSNTTTTLQYPTGQFEGLYWAEELRSAQYYGYIIEPLYGYLFSTADLWAPRPPEGGRGMGCWLICGYDFGIFWTSLGVVG